MNQQIARSRDLDWVLGRFSVATLGRSAMRTLDELMVATNRIVLIAPEPVLAAVLEVNSALESFKPRDSEWTAKWRAARRGVAKAARATVPHL
jgi:hypothetical protein